MSWGLGYIIRRIFLLAFVLVFTVAYGRAMAATNLWYGPTGFTQWPTNWTVIPTLNDPVDAGVKSALDFVGDATNPGGYWHQGTNYLFFRVQVHTNEITSAEVSDNIWIFIDKVGFNYANNETGQPDYAVAWDMQKDHGMEFQVWSINGSSWNKIKMNDVDGIPGSKKVPPDINTSGDGVVRTIDNVATTNFGACAYIDWAVSWSYLASTSTLARGQEWRVQLGSRVNGNDHVEPTSDIGGGFSPGDPVSNSWSVTVGTLTNEPAVQASNVSFSAVSATSMTVNWQAGSGGARLLVASTNPITWIPTDGIGYAANSNYSVAVDLGSGARVVYNGSGISCNVTGLTGALVYYFAVFEYNGSGVTANYLTDGTIATGSQKTLCSLQIISAHDNPSPAVGIHAYASGTMVTNGVTSPVELTSTQYVCSGWTLTGNGTDSTSATNVVLTLTNNAVLTWQWVTNVQFTRAAGPGGSVTGSASGWYALGGSVTVTAVPDASYQFAGWTGAVPAAQTNSADLALLLDQARNITANFRLEDPGPAAVAITNDAQLSNEAMIMVAAPGGVTYWLDAVDLDVTGQWSRVVTVTNPPGYFLYTDTNLIGRVDFRFYRAGLVHNGVTTTNPAIYEAFVQPLVTGRWYELAMPVGCDVSNRLDSTFGAEVARGLNGNDVNGDLLYALGVDGNWRVYLLNAERKWVPHGGGGTAQDAISSAHGYWIKRRTGGVSTNAVYIGPVHTNSETVVFRSNDWHMISWPFPRSRREDAGIHKGWGFAEAGARGGTTWMDADQLVCDSGTNSVFLYLGLDGRWHRITDPAPVSDVALRHGVGYYYYHSGTGFSWSANEQ